MERNDCIFCRIADKRLPARIVFEDDRLLAFEDIKPQAPLHLLIMPRAHIEKVSDLKAEDGALMGEMVMRAKEIAAEKCSPEAGYRIVLNCDRDAGQEVFHIHMHLLGGRKFGWPPG